jgi:DNA-directed RNA polymerase specialized sigma24 family protein
MSDDPEESKARAMRAFEHSIVPEPGEMFGPVYFDQIATMERALLSLPRLTREIFLAHRLDAYNYAHIAEVTGLSERQVGRRMATALRRLDRYLRGDERSAWQRWWQQHLPRWRR